MTQFGVAHPTIVKYSDRRSSSSISLPDGLESVDDCCRAQQGLYMSPSRIPRPGGGAPSPLGPNADLQRNNQAGSPGGNGSGIRSAPGSPANFKPNPVFIQPRGANSLSPSPPQQHPARLPQPKRRPKPPSPELEDAITLTPPSNARRRPEGSPDLGVVGSGLPRPRPRGVSGGINSPGGPYVGPTLPNGSPRSCLRQPSTPSLSTVDRNRVQAGMGVVKNDPAGASGGPADSPRRARAASAAADTRNAPLPPTSTIAVPAVPHLFAPSFAESREPSVPPHIRIRLRLIHHLGVVLGMDAQGISSKIDVPGLLARVDAAYDRGHSAVAGSAALGRDSSDSSQSSVTSGLPLPLRPISDEGNHGAGMGKRGSKGEKGVMGMFRRLGRSQKGEEERVPVAYTSVTPEAFGVQLNEAPAGSWCTSLIGGQKHELPLVVFTIVEEIYRRGMSQPGIFRLAGDGTRISHLTKVFNLPPLYGDSLSIANEPIHNLTGLVKRYIRDLPEPILDESLFPAFLTFCAEPEPGALVMPLSTRISAAQILLKLLPPLHFSLFVYLLAFLGQLPLFPDNRLNVESISIIFGPAMCAARGKGISGLGPSTAIGRNGKEHDPEQVSNLVNQSQSTLAWLLKHWAAISEKVLDPPFEEADAQVKDDRKTPIDPKLLSPIDLRTSPPAKPEGASTGRGRSATVSGNPPEVAIPTASPPQRSSSMDATRESALSSSSPRPGSSHSLTSTEPSPKTPAGPPEARVMSTSHSSGSGIFARALSSMSISSDARGESEKVPKRSASFTSLSSLVKKGGALMGRGESKSRSSNDGSISPSASMTGSIRGTVNPQITTVLGSLHDLLVNKDKQIERDARELALLRHTLLEMDEKLQRATAPALGLSTCTCGGSSNPPTPEITITSTPSTTTLATKDRELSEVQTQLTTALAALETARLQSRKQADATLDLEAKLARADSEKRLEMSKLEVALALEQAKVVGLVEERDVARERLEKVKTTLFSVA